MRYEKKLESTAGIECLPEFRAWYADRHGKPPKDVPAESERCTSCRRAMEARSLLPDTCLMCLIYEFGGHEARLEVWRVLAGLLSTLTDREQFSAFILDQEVMGERLPSVKSRDTFQGD